MFARIPRDSHPRGQALVEMAIILPLLIIFMVMAIDAGRMFFGWVALQNAGRIGADYAASHADAWNGVPSPIEQAQQDRYVVLITEDLQALGCQSGFVVPAPNFDPDGDGTNTFSDGALAAVELDCTFDLLTPLAESFLGRPFTMHTRADFAVNRTYVGGIPAPGGPPPPGATPTPGPPSPTPAPTPPPCPAGQAKVPLIVGERNIDAFGMWQGAGFTGSWQPVAQGPNRNRRVAASPPPSLAPGSCQLLSASIVVTLQ